MGGGVNGLPVKDRTVPKERTKPVLDEQTFSKLLEAAYVIQERNLRAGNLPIDLEREPCESEVRDPSARGTASMPQVSGSDAQADSAIPLAKIVQTQHDIQVRHLQLENALQLVADRVVEMELASGAAIGMVEGSSIRYRAVSGQSTPIAESSLPPNKCLCAPCLKAGKALRCGDVALEPSLDSKECKKRGIRSLLAVPIFHDGVVVGGLELYYPSPRTITDQDVHTCQLMAGLVTEALARDEEITSKQSLATERAAMLRALERLKPNFAALMEQPRAKPASDRSAPAATSRFYSCHKCGHQLKPEEQFCVQCGTPRLSDYEFPSMQSKVASLWQMQESRKKDLAADGARELPARVSSGTEPASVEETLFARSVEEQMPEVLVDADHVATESAEQTASGNHLEEIVGVEDEELPADEEKVAGEELKPSEALAVAKTDRRSALSARTFLEKLTPAKHRGTLLRLWITHRGDIYLGIAVVLVLSVILWGVRSDHSRKTTGSPSTTSASHRKSSPESDLSFFERVLVQLGLAEPPPAPEDKGNPTVEVWVDLHTALYYCPGTDLYGKTPQGKFTTQRAAQLDQFEPAYRKTCQ